MVKLIAFDLDGTLIDSSLDLANAINHMRMAMKLEPLTIDRVISFIGDGVITLVRRSIAGTGVDLEQALCLMKEYYSNHLLDNTNLYPGVKTGLAELNSLGIKLAVVTNKLTGAAGVILKELGVMELFAELIGGDSDYPLKPSPEALKALCAKYSCLPENCWILGDHYTDLEAGRRAGFRRAFAQYGLGEPRAEKDFLAVDSFAEFVNSIKAAL